MLCFLTTGDGPEALKEAVSYFGGKVRVLKVPHHGNSCSKSNAQAVKSAGCTLAYETNVEAKGAGTTGFTAYGSRRLVQQGVKVLMQDADITMTASSGKLAVKQAGKGWTFDVPYDGKPAVLYRVRRSWDDTASQIGAYSVLENAKAAADKKGAEYAVFDPDGKEIYRPRVVPYLIRLKESRMIRSGPGDQYLKTGRETGAGVFTIIEEKDGYGKLKSGLGWVSLPYAEKL